MSCTYNMSEKLIHTKKTNPTSHNIMAIVWLREMKQTQMGLRRSQTDSRQVFTCCQTVM